MKIAFVAALVVGCGIASARAQDMALSQVLIPGEAWELVARGFKFTEGPAVDAAGDLYFTDIPNNRIHRLSHSTGEARVFVEDTGGANGLMFGPDGRLYACQNGRKQIVAYDRSGKFAVVASGFGSNDLVIDGQGGVYITDFGGKRVRYIAPDGKERVVDEGIEKPNGIILTPDQGTLYVSEFAGKNLWAFRVGKDGSLSGKSPYATCVIPLGTTEGKLDGMTVDTAGRIYVASAVGLQVFDPTGRLSGVISKPQSAFLSNAVFAGPELDTLYVTSSDKIYRRKVLARGIRYFAPRALP